MDNKKATAAALAAAIAASSAAVDASFDDPADILQDSGNVEPQIEYVGADGDQDGSSAVQDDEKKQQQEQKKMGTFREWILSLPMIVRMLFVVPQWVIGNVITAGASFLFAGLSPVFNWILSFVVLGLVIAGAFTVTAKCMFPDLPLKKILNKRTFKGILIATVVIFAADIILGIVWPGYGRFKILIMAILTLAALAGLSGWFARIESKRRALLGEAEVDAPEDEEPEELVFTSLGQEFKIRKQH